MKKMWYYTLMLFALCFIACEDTDKLEADINSLNDRVVALENKVEMLNGNIKALNILCQDGMIISKVEHDAENGVYTLSLSDGTTLKLAERVDGFASVPLVTINENGNWAVSYDDGASFVEIKKGDAPVYAIGKDGITPEFRVGTEDFWEISLDGGNNYVRVLDENGNPVKAVYDPVTNPNQQFTGVVQKTDCLEITLSSDNTVKVPIVPDFFCYFDRAITGEQNINPGGTKTFNVHINGAESTVTTAPMGWKATLAEADAITHVAVLTVIAPKGKPATRAIADNTRDISILAMKGGLATLTKIQVNPIEVETGGGDEPTPISKLITPLSASTTVVNLWGEDPYKEVSGLEDFWFHKSNKKDEATAKKDGIVSLVDETIGSTQVKALQLEYFQAYDVKDASKPVNNSYYISTMGYYKKAANLSNQKQYTLSFKVKKISGGEDASKNKILVAMVFPDPNNNGKYAAFPVFNSQGESTTALYSKLFDEVGVWSEKDVTVTFDLRYRANVGSISTNNPKGNTVPENTQDIDIRFYTQQANTTFCIADVKLQEYTPVAQ